MKIENSDASIIFFIFFVICVGRYFWTRYKKKQASFISFWSFLVKTQNLTMSNNDAAADQQAWRNAAQNLTYNLNVNDARLTVAKTKTLFFYKIIMGTLFAIIAAAALIAIQVYKIYKQYIDLVKITNEINNSRVSGLGIAMCLHNWLFNAMFGPTSNPNFSSALWLMWYSHGMRDTMVQSFGGGSNNNGDVDVSIWSQAVKNCIGNAQQDPTLTAMQLACAAVNATSTSEVGQHCFQTCPFPAHLTNDDPATAAAQGALSMGGAIGGMGMLASGPAGLVMAGIGAVVGGVLGGLQAQQRHEKFVQECNNSKTSGYCYWPPTFPPCS